MINCLILEDEFPAREELKYFINKNENFHLKMEFENPIDALKYNNFENIDVIFLDINMPELDGMSFAKLVARLNKNIKFVFISAYKDFAVEAFEIKAFDYILKPYSEERIETLLRNLISIFSKEDIESNKKSFNKLTLNKDGKLVVISTKDICYIEAIDKEIKVFTSNNVFYTKLKLNELEEILPPYFFRSHRSYIINLDKVIEIEPWFNSTFLLKTTELDFKIPVSRNKTKEIKELLNIK